MRVWILLVIVLLLAGCTSNPGPVPQPAALTITTTSLPAASLNHTYTQQLTAAGGTAPYVWSVASGSLPAGITLSSSGVLVGVPTQQGAFSFTIQVMDSATATAKIQIGGDIDEIS